MTWLLDGNALAALMIDSHEHHARVFRWFDERDDPFATCAITQGTLLRVHMLMAVDHSAKAAWTALHRLSAHPDHVYWEEGFDYLEVPFAKVQGHRQVTDAWLATLARRRNGKLLTLDAALAALHRDVALLAP